MKVTLFDLDGVLTTKDTMATLITHRLRQKPFRLLVVLPIYAVGLIAGSHRELAAQANRLAVRVAFTGVSESEYRTFAATIGRQLGVRSGFIREDLVQLCRTSRGSSRVVIVIASERHLVEGLLEACGLSGTEVLASRIAFSKRVPRLVLHNVGSRKIHSLRAAGVPIQGATFYTDSASDLPLALVVARAVIVHPRRSSRRRLLAALPQAQIIE